MPLIPTFSSHYLFYLCIPLITTFSSPNCGVGRISGSKLKFMVVMGWVCDSGIGITWVQVSRLPMPHPDNDKWKCTMFTNKLYVSVHLVDKILQVNVYTGEQYNMMVYKNNNNNWNNNMHKMMSITNSEPYGSIGACNKCSYFLLKGECCKLRVKHSTFFPEGRICNIMY